MLFSKPNNLAVKRNPFILGGGPQGHETFLHVGEYGSDQRGCDPWDRAFRSFYPTAGISFFTPSEFRKHPAFILDRSMEGTRNS